MGRDSQNLVSFQCTGPFVHDTDTLNSPGPMGGSENQPQRDTLRLGLGDRSAGLEEVGEGERRRRGCFPGKRRGAPGMGRWAAGEPRVRPLIQCILEQPGNRFSW